MNDNGLGFLILGSRWGLGDSLARGVSRPSILSGRAAFKKESGR